MAKLNSSVSPWSGLPPWLLNACSFQERGIDLIVLRGKPINYFTWDEFQEFSIPGNRLWINRRKDFSRNWGRNALRVTWFFKLCDNHKHFRIKGRVAESSGKQIAFFYFSTRTCQATSRDVVNSRLMKAENNRFKTFFLRGILRLSFCFKRNLEGLPIAKKEKERGFARSMRRQENLHHDDNKILRYSWVGIIWSVLIWLLHESGWFLGSGSRFMQSFFKKRFSYPVTWLGTDPLRLMRLDCKK